MMFQVGLLEITIVFLSALLIICFWKIFSKAGFSGWLSLTQIFPIVNLIGLIYLAFARWPVQIELEQLKEKSAQSGT